MKYSSVQIAPSLLSADFARRDGGCRGVIARLRDQAGSALD